MNSSLSSSESLHSGLTEEVHNIRGSASVIRNSGFDPEEFQKSVIKYQSGAQEIQESLNKIYESMNNSMVQSIRIPNDSKDLVITKEMLVDLKNKMKDISKENTMIKNQLKSLIEMSDGESKLKNSSFMSKSHMQQESPVDKFKHKLIMLIKEKDNLLKRLDQQIEGK